MTTDPFVDMPTREAIGVVRWPVVVIADFAAKVAALSALESESNAGALRGLRRPIGHGGGVLRRIEATGGVTTSIVSLVTAMAPDSPPYKR